LEFRTRRKYLGLGWEKRRERMEGELGDKGDKRDGLEIGDRKGGGR
jgi:hypothetical protein